MKLNKKESTVFAFAVMNGICDLMEIGGYKSLMLADESSKKRDLVQFTDDGCKYTIWAIGKPDIETGEIGLLAESNGDVYTIGYNCGYFHRNTLEKILYKVYSRLNNGDAGWDNYIKELVLGYYDTLL